MNLQRTKRPLLRALRHARMDALGYRSVDEIAERAKVARNTIYNWEKGFSPALEELDRVAVALDVPLSEMVDAWSGRQHEAALRPKWAEGLATKADIDAMIETLIPVVLDRVWEQSRPELLRQLRDALTHDNGGSSQ